MASDSTHTQVNGILKQAKALDAHDKAHVIKKLLQSDEITVVLGTRDPAMAEILVKIQKMENFEIAQILQALADRIRSRN